jgi:hypothetical protein
MAKALALSAAVLAAALTGCSPFGGGNFTCETNANCRAGGVCQPNGFCTFEDPTCTSGQRYEDHSGTNSGVCVGDEPEHPEAGIPDAPDGTPQPVCFGAATGLVKPCFASAPTGDVRLATALNTDTSPMCMAPMSGGDGFCVIAGASITVEASVGVSGSKPLVLVAVGTIDVSSRLDVASHHNPAAPFATTQIGAGSAPSGGCNAGTAPGANGGGAGGSLIGLGGTGGKSAGGTGTPGAAQTITALRGGCPGQDGQTGTFGLAGHGGGAVYLIANTAINISAPLNASGEGGRPGITGSAGAGGGGSGGMIGLDSPVINNTSAVLANGASGGEGSGMGNAGEPGAEPNTAAATPPAAGGTTNGGDGGRGSTGGGGMANGGDGQNGGVGLNLGGGGGGGGGVGIIKVYRGTLTGEHSPPPTP